MYDLEKSAFGPYTRYTVQNRETGNGFSVVPECGANLLALLFESKNVLDGYATPEELTEAKWGKSALLFPFPNRLDQGKYIWQGETYQFPLNNAATGNAIHGFVRSQVFELDSVLLTKDSASLICSYTYNGSLAYYPFPFRVEIGFSIYDDRSFHFEFSVENLHDESIPVGFGWHPYFKLTETADAHLMQLPACEKVNINDRMIPTGGTVPYAAFETKQKVADTVLDNTFLCKNLKEDYELLLEANGAQLLVRASADACPYFQVFTPPHRQSIALEPMSCNVDAFNNQDNLIELEAGERQDWAMEILYNQ
jgi:aldose 1-epimerase